MAQIYTPLVGQKRAIWWMEQILVKWPNDLTTRSHVAKEYYYNIQWHRSHIQNQADE